MDEEMNRHIWIRKYAAKKKSNQREKIRNSKRKKVERENRLSVMRSLEQMDG